MTGRPIRVLLAEDQGMMRGALALLLGSRPSPPPRSAPVPTR
ncbi:hypothetical protein [Streptomyces violarus]|uniref:DNA-binding response regulator n=1 Tax=Streptomyces violarus TaxID=67380 RepID=A0A7W5F1M5_9ACTN|nr:MULTISPECIES: hypothetical protein [Streptomyces]MBB3076725.1 hypothetical protein [Streptomyces violarus]WRU03797.1 hypothetical protein VJ737_29750 [Streptomyces sp. CGMCC 4.1772]